jgi:hypothetical protein
MPMPMHDLRSVPRDLQILPYLILDGVIHILVKKEVYFNRPTRIEQLNEKIWNEMKSISKMF